MVSLHITTSERYCLHIVRTNSHFYHQNVRGVCEEGCGAVSMLALRCPSHAKQLEEAGAGSAILQVMKMHPNVVQIQVSTRLFLTVSKHYIIPQVYSCITYFN